jgi:hypothetical protein
MMGPPYDVGWCAAETLEAHRVAFLGVRRGDYFLFLQFGVLREAIMWGLASASVEDAVARRWTEGEERKTDLEPRMYANRRELEDG